MWYSVGSPEQSSNALLLDPLSVDISETRNQEASPCRYIADAERPSQVLMCCFSRIACRKAAGEETRPRHGEIQDIPRQNLTADSSPSQFTT